MVGTLALCPPYAPIVGLLPRRLLFAAIHFEPERAAGEACGVEIALGADALEVQHGAQALADGFDVTVPA